MSAETPQDQYVAKWYAGGLVLKMAEADGWLMVRFLPTPGREQSETPWVMPRETWDRLRNGRPEG